jgi:hypothetical protein
MQPDKGFSISRGFAAHTECISGRKKALKVLLTNLSLLQSANIPAGGITLFFLSMAAQ